MEIEVGGSLLVLRPERALWWPQQQLLVVADVHFGKAVTFRRLGVPVPQGTTSDTLDRLSRLLRATAATRLVFLGDLLHSARALAPATMAAVQAWRDAHAALELHLVRGNHDLRAGDPPAAWRIKVAEDALRMQGLVLRHEPQVQADGYVLAGHVHPCAAVGGRGPDRLRLPCFHFGPRIGLLPAFGAFTGMHAVRSGPGDRTFVVAGDEVRALPGSLHSRA